MAIYETDDTSASEESYLTDELDFNSYRLEEIREGMASHTLQKVDAILDDLEQGRTYNLTITEHPDGGAWVRASPTETNEVYRERLDVFPPTEASVEEILDGVTLDRAY